MDWYRTKPLPVAGPLSLLCISFWTTHPPTSEHITKNRSTFVLVLELGWRTDATLIPKLPINQILDHLMTQLVSFNFSALRIIIIYRIISRQHVFLPDSVFVMWNVFSLSPEGVYFIAWNRHNTSTSCCCCGELFQSDWFCSVNMVAFS